MKRREILPSSHHLDYDGCYLAVLGNRQIQQDPTQEKRLQEEVSLDCQLTSPLQSPLSRSSASQSIPTPARWAVAALSRPAASRAAFSALASSGGWSQIRISGDAGGLV